MWPHTGRFGWLPLLLLRTSFPKETLETSFCCEGHTCRQNNPSGDPLYPIQSHPGPGRCRGAQEDETLARDRILCLQFLLSLLTGKNRACLKPQAPAQADQPVSQY